MSDSECQTNGRHIFADDNLVDESVDAESDTQSIVKRSVNSRTYASIMLSEAVEAVEDKSSPMNLPEPDLVKVTDMVESAGCTIDIPAKPTNIELEVKHSTERHVTGANMESAGKLRDSLKRLRFEAVSEPTAATNIGFSSFKDLSTGSLSLSRTIPGKWIYACRLDHEWHRAYLLHLNGDGTVKLKWAATGEVDAEVPLDRVMMDSSMTPPQHRRTRRRVYSTHEDGPTATAAKNNSCPTLMNSGPNRSHSMRATKTTRKISAPQTINKCASNDDLTTCREHESSVAKPRRPHTRHISEGSPRESSEDDILSMNGKGSVSHAMLPSTLPPRPLNLGAELAGKGRCGTFEQIRPIDKLSLTPIRRRPSSIPLVPYTVQSIVAELSDPNNASLVDLRDALVLFLPQITTPHTLAELLVKRFNEGCGEVDMGQEDKFKRMIRQNKVLSVIKFWLKSTCGKRDFVSDPKCRKVFKDFFDRMTKGEWGSGFAKRGVQCNNDLRNLVMAHALEGVLDRHFPSRTRSDPSRARRDSNFFEHPDALALQSSIQKKSMALQKKTLKKFAVKIAAQMTIRDMEALSKVDHRELIDARWTKPNKLALAPNVVHIINMFNNRTNWVICSVLDSLIHRKKKVVIFFVLLAQELMQLQNYNTMAQIVIGLSSPFLAEKHIPVAWKAVSQKQKKWLAEHKRLVSSKDNYAAYREFVGGNRFRGNRSFIPCWHILVADLFIINKQEKGYEQINRSLKNPDGDRSINVIKYLWLSQIILDFFQRATSERPTLKRDVKRQIQLEATLGNTVKMNPLMAKSMLTLAMSKLNSTN